MSVEHTNDIDLRIAVINRLFEQGIDRKNIRHEIPMDTASSGGRMDVVVLSDIVTCIEIKSGKDTLKKLLEQANRYMRAADVVKVVMDARWINNRKNSLRWYSNTFFWHRDLGFVDQYRGELQQYKAVDLVVPRFSNSGVTNVVDMCHLFWAEEAREIAPVRGIP